MLMIYISVCIPLLYTDNETMRAVRRGTAGKQNNIVKIFGDYREEQARDAREKRLKDREARYLKKIKK